MSTLCARGEASSDQHRSLGPRPRTYPAAVAWNSRWRVRRTVLIRRQFAQVAGLAGTGLAGAFYLAAKIRGGRPIHPKGVIYDATISRHGIRPPTGTDWLDRPGEDRGLVRLSRSAGLPESMPDVHGMALTFTGAHGERCDVLLSTTGRSVPARFVLAPRRDPWTAFYSSLLPYTASGKPILLAAVQVEDGKADDDTRVFELLAAELTGPWRPFGLLELHEPADAAAEPHRFDPRHVPPGLQWPSALMRIREPAYAAAQKIPVR